VVARTFFFLLRYITNYAFFSLSFSSRVIFNTKYILFRCVVYCIYVCIICIDLINE
jgi:hypothetical protein